MSAHRFWFRLVATLAAVLLLTVAGHASGRKVALVLGNGSYAAAPALPNPLNDARAVARMLSDVGFEVTTGYDLSADQMRRSVRDFEQTVSGASIALVYYAGHGIEVGGTNFLIPVDAELKRDTHVEDEAIPLTRILDAVAEAETLRLVLLDACRDNPFANRIQRSGAKRSIGRGFAPIEPATYTLVSYAAEAGFTAEDGDGEHSPYARALLETLPTPGLEVNFVFRRVNAAVREATGGRQQPVFYGSLGTEEVYLVPGEPKTVARDPAADFKAAQAVGTADAYRAFLEHHPDGFFADLARESMVKLERVQVAAVTADPAVANDALPENASLEEIYWRTIRDSVLADDFRAYLARFPDGAFADLAKARLDALSRADEVNALAGAPAGTRPEKAALRQAAMARADRLPVNMLQYGLIALGFEVDTVTGVLDRNTRKAARSYQASIGAEQTGVLTAQQKVDLLLAAASVGDSHAQTAVGFMTAQGVGLDVDYRLARIWFERARRQGNPYGALNLGVLVRDGLGGHPDRSRARSLFAEAAENGVEEAKVALRSLEGG
ncbi:caspase family protein [Chthonobacter rhizosphaerae]|uniref:caspase family protein n=1 Tax=Chthonobacter rhizosphaerae TaxID=2735553 RepID=UPI0015EE8DDB|nr:caspase family protein [Chthonobacter rhizosphaerae]